MPRLGVSKTDTTPQLVPFRNMLMILVRVMVLCTKAVKPIMTVPVKKPVIPKPVRQARSSKRTPGDVLMIPLMGLVVNLPVVQVILL